MIIIESKANAEDANNRERFAHYLTYELAQVGLRPMDIKRRPLREAARKAVISAMNYSPALFDKESVKKWTGIKNL